MHSSSELLFSKDLADQSSIIRKLAETFQVLHYQKRVKELFRFYKLVLNLLKIRSQASVYIQRVFRGYQVRKEILPILQCDRNTLVRWSHGGEEVFLVGDFTENPWAVFIRLSYSKYLNEFYSTSAFKSLKPGTYLMKFVVDGKWVCDGHIPISNDEKGNFNNVLCVRAHRNIPRAMSVRSICSTNLSDQISKTRGCSPLLLARSLSSNNTPVKRYMENVPAYKDKLRLKIDHYMAGKPKNKNAPLSETTSVDSYFVDSELQAFGIADGVGEWQAFGLDASRFPKELMKFCQIQIKEEMALHSDLEPSDLLEQALCEAHKKTKSFGSSTALLCMCKDSFLHCLNLGDSGVIVLRKRLGTWTTIYRCIEQQHRFNCPFQLSNLPKDQDFSKLSSLGLKSLVSLLQKSKNCMNDSPFDAENEMIPLRPNDVIVAGSDGIFDNLFEDEIRGIVERSPKTPKIIAKTLVEAAIRNGWSPTYKSPFAKKAAKAGKKFTGGKLDDTTAVVAIATLPPKQLTHNAIIDL